MNDNHRKRILQNVDRLINFTDYEKLCQACKATELLSDEMVQIIHLVEPLNTGEPCDEDNIKKVRHKKLLEKITKRGPDAYEKLRRIFRDLKYNEAMAILVGEDDRILSIRESKATVIRTSTPNNNNNVEVVQGGEPNRQLERINSIDDDNTLHEYNGDICPKIQITVKKSTRISEHPVIKTYPMESKDNRGVFFMVNIIDFPQNPSLKRREGADDDAHSLLNLFKQLGFKLFSYRNITEDDFWNILDELLNSEYTKHTECFVMALMTHGDMVCGVESIAFGDGSVVQVKDIEQRFYHQMCPNLIHKPKILLFPFCRGDTSEESVKVVNKIQTDGFGVHRSQNIGHISDICICYATSENYMAHRDPDDGSWYIQYNKIQTDGFGVHRSQNIGHISDICICYATSENYMAHRDPDDGSWYIQSFVKNMAELAHHIAFEDIIKKIQADTVELRTTDKQLQTPCYVNKCFNKMLYFNPGIYKE